MWIGTGEIIRDSKRWQIFTLDFSLVRLYAAYASLGNDCKYCSCYITRIVIYEPGYCPVGREINVRDTT